MPDDPTTANARHPVLGGNLLQADPSRQVQDQNLCYAIKRKPLLPHFVGFRWIVGHKLHTDRTVVEYGVEFEHFVFYHRLTIGEGTLAAASPQTPWLGGNSLRASLGDLLVI
jgi:hypothetical protein